MQYQQRWKGGGGGGGGGGDSKGNCPLRTFNLLLLSLIALIIL